MAYEKFRKSGGVNPSQQDEGKTNHDPEGF
jgi:hypothetical protein